ncbi:hypothetical protein [Pelosinus sp. IPA-1]|uniref:hypothetical protein n=1 Tax=Pelosinus sp. IPA-1 TaxID=3029569 RepID=UPI0024361BCD|nr:hypothetical protein [Pelosinus sp. IPA-1]GMA98778.1 hypothetical protein PIPA1_15780 [Pelosinus sp. IPA-1]
MNKVFIKGIYKTVVEENKELYKDLFNNTTIDKRTDEYWKQSLNLYNNLSKDNKEALMNIIEQTMIDTISNIFGIIDGSSTLNGCNIKTKLLLDGKDTDGELQDTFLEYVEELKE